MKFLRKYRLTVGVPSQRYEVTTNRYEVVPSKASVIDDLHIEFDITKSDDSSKNLNSATIKIMNLSEATRDLIEVPDSVVILEAGWEDDSYGLIFQGDIVTYQHQRGGTEWVTELICADGYLGVRESITNRTFPGGSSVQSILTDLIKGEPGGSVYYTTGVRGDQGVRPPSGLGLAIGEFSGLGLFDTFDNSLTISKPTKQAIDDICYAHKLKWSIQDGAAYVTSAVGDTEYKYTVPLISEATGLMESPERIKKGVSKRKNDKTPDKGYSFKCTLNHELVPELFVRLESEQVNEIMKIKKVKHQGSYEGGSWETSVEAIIQEIG